MQSIVSKFNKHPSYFGIIESVDMAPSLARIYRNYPIS
jgi:hypothetical protein